MSKKNMCSRCGSRGRQTYECEECWKIICANCCVAHKNRHLDRNTSFAHGGVTKETSTAAVGDKGKEVIVPLDVTRRGNVLRKLRELGEQHGFYD